MDLKDFKIGDTIIQKNNKNARWLIKDINFEENYISLVRKGGYFNDMITHINLNHKDFEAAGRTEQRINREKKIEDRTKKQIDFQNKKKSVYSKGKKITPKELSIMAHCSSKKILDAIKKEDLIAFNTSSKNGRGNRYLIDYENAMEWLEKNKQAPVENEKDSLTVRQISEKYNISESTIRNDIKNKKINPDEDNRISLDKIEEWMKNRNFKPKKYPIFDNVKIIQDNPFTPGSRNYSYFLTLINNNNQATYQTIINDCLENMKKFGISDSEDKIRKDLNTKIYFWRKNPNINSSYKIGIDDTNCRKGANGRILNGETKNIKIILKELR